MISEYIEPDSKMLLVFCEAALSPSFVCSGCGSSGTVEFPGDVLALSTNAMIPSRETELGGDILI